MYLFINSVITIVVIIKVRYNKTDEEDLDVSDK